MNTIITGALYALAGLCTAAIIIGIHMAYKYVTKKRGGEEVECRYY